MVSYLSAQVVSEQSTLVQLYYGILLHRICTNAFDVSCQVASLKKAVKLGTASKRVKRISSPGLRSEVLQPIFDMCMNLQVPCLCWCWWCILPVFIF